ncbi:tonB-dependent receptor, putative [Babesia ovata]|uniref:TonB-dependent receptor, putative n=1 Tax=Babesia ovata TaxID=189622 RepID=A0A2H6KA42_9APIC|nr:tonB-dependent receptor, putative [Babesia ovata]GBE59867.1 tonB-dependent receptor, putative [Babesia ovata]
MRYLRQRAKGACRDAGNVAFRNGLHDSLSLHAEFVLVEFQGLNKNAVLNHAEECSERLVRLYEYLSGGVNESLQVHNCSGGVGAGIHGNLVQHLVRLARSNCTEDIVQKRPPVVKNGLHGLRDKSLFSLVEKLQEVLHDVL